MINKKIKRSSLKAQAAPSITAAPKRGRPRSEHLHAAMLNAARQLLEQGGLPAVTMEAIAERAGVGKPTVYRYWPNAHAVAMAAMMDSSAPTLAVSTHQNAKRVQKSSQLRQSPTKALSRLRLQLSAIANAFSTPIGRNVTMMIASADSNTELSKVFRNHFIHARREEGRELLTLAIEQGELRGDIDFEVALDLIYGPLFYRLLSGHARLNEAFTEALLSHVFKGLQARLKRA
jgi:AcrR family transcriptional regulator